jgi:hypothetical protein
VKGKEARMSPSPTEFVLLRTFGYRHEAEFVKSVLDSAAIDSVLVADDAGGAEAGLTFSNPARLMVRRQDIEAAAEVVREIGFGVDRD